PHTTLQPAHGEGLCRMGPPVHHLPRQWVFPATRLYVDRATGERRRHYLHESVLQRAVKDALCRAGISKRATCHTSRHSFATPRTCSRLAATSARSRSCRVDLQSRRRRVRCPHLRKSRASQLSSALPAWKGQRTTLRPPSTASLRRCSPAARMKR